MIPGTDLSWFKQENKLEIPQDCPSCSPDLNPIENAWGLVSTHLQKFMSKTVGDLIERYLETVNL